MATYATNEFRAGLKVLLEADPCSIIENEFVKPGKGQAFNRVKFRNLKTGRVWERTFKSGETIEAADVMEVEMEYLYTDGQFWHFMKTDGSYEQLAAGDAAISEARTWLKEQDPFMVTSMERRTHLRHAAELRATRGCRDRSGAQGRHRAGRDQTRHTIDRRHGQGAPVRQYRRRPPYRHAHRGVRQPSQELTADRQPGRDPAWGPACDIEALKVRAHMLRTTRRFFDQREVLEVQMPVLGRYAVTDPAIECIQTQGRPVSATVSGIPHEAAARRRGPVGLQRRSGVPGR